jgi:hypothetical protein
MKKINSIFLSALLFACAVNASAVQTPPGCSASALFTAIFTDKQVVSPGDTITYGIQVANDFRVNPLDCDVIGLCVVITTPDGIPHNIALARTTLTSGQSDYYSNVVTYVVSTNDVRLNGIVIASLSATVFPTNSFSYQSCNAKVLMPPVPIPAPVLLPAITQLQQVTQQQQAHDAIVDTNVASLNKDMTTVKKSLHLK